MTQTVLTTKLASTINAWIHAMSMILVAKMPNVRLLPIDLCVAALVVGQEILTLSAINVGYRSYLAEQH